MNEEKKTSQMKSSAGGYTAPKVKVKALRRRGVICASDPYNAYGGFTSPEQEGY